MSYELAGVSLDAAAASVQDVHAVFGRTLVVLKYEAGAKPAKNKK